MGTEIILNERNLVEFIKFNLLSNHEFYKDSEFATETYIINLLRTDETYLKLINKYINNIILMRDIEIVYRCEAEHKLYLYNNSIDSEANDVINTLNNRIHYLPKLKEN